MEPKKILIVEDEALIREGIASLLAGESFVGEIFQASNKKDFLAVIDKVVPDLVLLDFKLKDANGLELLNILRNKIGNIKAIVITGLEGTELLVNLLKAGVNGIVYKLDGYREIRTTIEKVLQGESYFPEKVLKLIQKNAGKWDAIPPVILNFSEREILRALSRGLTTKEMAGELRMSEATTETYRNRLMKKVNVPNTAALLAFAFRNGLL
jgi:DNA-binding NarL/FixJ family response regulator